MEVTPQQLEEIMKRILQILLAGTALSLSAQQGTAWVAGYVGDTAFEVCCKLLQMWGGSGIMNSTGVNRYMRDAKAKTIAEGASEMHYSIIANQILHGVPAMVRPASAPRLS